jgi:hypothetical protein
VERIEYHPKLVTRIAQIIFCLLLVVIGLWFRQDHTHTVARGVGALIAVSGVYPAIRLLLRVRDNTPRIVLDDAGLYDRMLGTPLIPWENIAAAKVVPFYGSSFIGILPIDQDERISNFSLIRRCGVFSNRVFGLPAFCINPNGLNAPPSEVQREIWRRLKEAGHVQAPEA